MKKSEKREGAVEAPHGNIVTVTGFLMTGVC